MDVLRRHWYQIGFGFATILAAILILFHAHISSFRLLLSISLITLFLQQFEQYQLPDGFPKIINTAMFKSKQPDRFPLNPNIALIINLCVGWQIYVLAIKNPLYLACD